MNFCPSTEKSSADLEAPLLSSEQQKEVKAVTITTPKETPKKKSVNKDDEADDESEASVIEARCNLFTGTYFFGFAIGFILQACSLCALSVLGISALASATDSTATTATTTTSSPIILPAHKELSVAAVYGLVLFSRYWVFFCMVLPPLFYAFVARRRNKARKSAGKTDKKKRVEDRHASVRVLLGAFLDCARFQFGVLGGTLVLSSGLGFYSLAVTTPFCALLAYYGVCVIVSFCILHVLQLFVDSVCADVSSVELTVRYDDDDDTDDEEEETEYSPADENDDDDIIYLNPPCQEFSSLINDKNIKIVHLKPCQGFSNPEN